MDSYTRNKIFMEHLDLINRTIYRNRLLLYALHLDWDDVYQELAIAALQAIDTFDAQRSESVKVHIWAKLQYAILTIKRQHKPHGMVPQGCTCPSVWSMEFLGEDRLPSDAEDKKEEQEWEQEKRLRQALARLDPQERQAVILYLEGAKPARKAEKSCFDTAMDKLREFYLTTQYAAQFGR